jgi:tetratricopeptide (TPR) repeat protein
MLATAAPVMGQPGGDLVPVSDVTGGSSVFVFRTSQRSAPKRTYTKSRATRTKTQRIESAQRVSKQYTTLAQVAPRRVRSEVVVPDDPRLPKIPTMPKDQAARLFAGVGEYYMNTEDYDKAIEFFREAVQLDDTFNSSKTGLSEALALKGNQVFVKDDKPDRARQFFEEALRYNPKNSPAYFGLAEVYTEQGEELQAVANYEKALSNDKDLTEIYVPLGILYYQQGEIAKSDDLLSKALKSGASEDSQTKYFIGLIRFSQNKNSEALAAFNKAKTIDPTNAEAFYYAGETLSRLDRDQDAIAEYKQAVTLRPNYFEAWFGMGSALYEMEKYPEAIEAYKQAVRYRNDNIEAYINLGDAYRQTGKNYNEAESAYNLATTFISRKSDYSADEAADVYSKVGFVIAKQCEVNIKLFKPCKWDAAVAALEKAAELSKNGVDAQNLGWAYYNAARSDMNVKNMDAARPKLEKAKTYLMQAAATSNPQYIEGSLLNLGMVLTDMGDYDGAIAALTKVTDKEPKWVFAINELGIAYSKKKDYKKASELFRKAIGRDSKFAAAHFNLGEAEFRNGNLGEAKKAYQNLKKLGRNDLAAQLELISGGAVRGA